MHLCRQTWCPTRRLSLLKLTVNGRIKQDATTVEMIFSVPAIVAFLSEFVTLQPGDVVFATARCRESARAWHFPSSGEGDYVRATIGPIGVLENPIEAEDDDDY